MPEPGSGEPVAANNPPPPAASADAAWIRVPTPFSVVELAVLCSEPEVLFRINPYYYFKCWTQTGPEAYHADLDNQSNQQALVLDMEVSRAAGGGFEVSYAQGIKRRTVFSIEPMPQGSYLCVTDDYESLAEGKCGAREAEVDKSLPAWGEALRMYFKRMKRWSWLPGWRWYMRRLWIPMKPSARRIVWLLYLITVAEFFFFLFVLLVFLLEQDR
jgi:hypothetical protein